MLESLAKLKLNTSLPAESSFPSSENPSALSLNYELSSDYGVEPSRLIKPPSRISIPGTSSQGYSTDQTSSPDDENRAIINPDQSISTLFGDDEDLNSVASSRALTMDEDSSSLSLETRENVALGKSSYLNNVNYIRDHLDFLNQNLNTNKSPRGSDSKYLDFVNISPDTIPGYNLLKQFGSSSFQTNLLYHGIKVGSTDDANTDSFSCKLAGDQRDYIETNS